MGYLILWIECLAASLLFVALLIACVERLRGNWARGLLGLFAFLGPLAGCLLLTVVVGVVEQNHRLGWFRPLVLLTLAYAVGGIAIWWRGGNAASLPGIPRRPIGRAAGSPWPSWSSWRCRS